MPSFLAGNRARYLVGIVAVLGGAALTFLFFPKHQAELDVLAKYRGENPAFAKAERGRRVLRNNN